MFDNYLKAHRFFCNDTLYSHKKFITAMKNNLKNWLKRDVCILAWFVSILGHFKRKNWLRYHIYSLIINKAANFLFLVSTSNQHS